MQQLKRYLNIIISAVLIFATLFSVMWNYLQYQVKQPKFKQRMLQTVTEQIGRKVILDGDCDLSFSPLGIKLTDVTIKSPQNWADDADFLKAKEFRFQVKLQSLLDGRIEVAKIVLKHFTINLMTSKIRGDNWSYWGQKTASNAPRTDKEKLDLSYLEINELDLIDGHIQLIEQKEPKLTLQLNRLNLSNLAFLENSRFIASYLPKILMQLNFTGRGDIATLTWENFTVQQLKFNLIALDGLIQVRNCKWLWPTQGEGQLRGQLALNAGKDQLLVSWDVKNLRLIDLAPLAPGIKDVDGIVESRGQLATEFDQLDEFQDNLTVKGQIALNNGVYYGLDIPFQIRRARDLVTGTVNEALVDQNRTTLDHLNVKLESAKGKIKLANIDADTPDTTISGQGQINLKRRTLQANMQVKLKKEPDIVVPLKLSGELSRPRLSLDLKRFMDSQIKNLIPQVLDILAPSDAKNADKWLQKGLNLLNGS